MTIKIIHPSAKPAAVETPANKGASSASPAATGAHGVQMDQAGTQVQISSEANSLMSSASPEFNAEKVAAMSAAIANGTFKVDAAAIADKLLSNAKEALGKVSGN